MPIEIHFHEQGIYRAEWIDNVAIEEVIIEMQNVRNLAIRTSVFVSKFLYICFL